MTIFYKQQRGGQESFDSYGGEIFGGVMQRLELSVGMLVEMKKPHPCGNVQFRITRTGADIRAVCCGCGREILIPRVKFEKAVKKVAGFAPPV